MKGRGGGIFNNHPPRTRIIVIMIHGQEGRGELPASFCAVNGCVDCRGSKRGRGGWLV